METENNYTGVSVSLRQILTAEAFRDHRIFVGEDCLDTNMVSRVTVTDVPGNLTWVEPGELICTTGYVLSKQPESQIQWLESAAEHGAAAVVIKPERFLGYIPEEMIETAKRLNLPLIGLPIMALWSDVIKQVMSMILSKQMKILQDTYALHHKLEKIVLSSAGTKKLLEELSNIVGCSVILDDQYCNPMERACLYGIDDEIQEAARAARRRHLETARLREKSKHGHRTWLISTEYAEGEFSQLMLPVVAGEHNFGWLSAFPVPKDKQDFVRTAMEHGATAVALDQLGRYTGMLTRTEQINAFFKAMINEKGLPHTEIEHYGKIWDVSFERPAVCIRIRVSDDIVDSVFRNCMGTFKECDKDSLITLEKNLITVLYHPTAEDEADVINECRRICYETIRYCSINKSRCYVGVGKRFSIYNCSQFRQSFREAMMCVERACQTESTILFYSDLGVSRLFTFFADDSEFREEAESLLRPLLDNDTGLVKTLQCYIAKGLNKAKAAKELCVHVNTLNYRLAKIQDLLGLDVTDVETYLFYYVAIVALADSTGEEDDHAGKRSGIEG